MGKGSRDWSQIYAIYGMDEWQTFLFLFFHALIFSLLSVFILHFFAPFTSVLSALRVFSLLPPGSARFVAGLIGSVTALIAVCLLFAAANFLYSAVPLRWEISQRMISAVTDWSNVKTALDVGCGRGILLNAVALQLKKQGSSGIVVGLDQKRSITLQTLQTASLEGVQEYVTCREGDVRRLPFRDDYFDVVVSGAAIRRAGAKEERERVVGEMVRVLKPGGVGVVWDLQHVPEYVRKLQELRMEEIRVSERVTAYMVSSHIVSFRKPCYQQLQNMVGPVYSYAGEVRLDWRCHNLC
ncbi:uncharacterized protein LOC110693227 [Chenopodium quinoa]|uniref:Methyltransferase type 11 domain-containing protein n=1 Tax=Chenopodium quinoa TaxID=63459 RepID=A0A803MH86_CHEQI|nr:uncharacterized protein LOC110693227 [Chenopodium quinoa]